MGDQQLTLPSSPRRPSKFQQEQVLLAATSLSQSPGSSLKGASVSVTKTLARRLLQDFGVEWWFADLSSMKDVGGAGLVTELLILQRQGEFETKRTVSKVLAAELSDDDELLFSFETPLSDSVSRRTIAKAVLRSGALYVCWVSSLASEWGEDNDRLFRGIRDSFSLV